MQDKQMYLTDDRDLPLEEQKSLVIFQGGNGDWYVQVAPAHGRTFEGVRLCTSGGASYAVPGLTNAIAEAYRCMKEAAEENPGDTAPSYYELDQEVRAWRRKAPDWEYAFGQIQKKEV